MNRTPAILQQNRKVSRHLYRNMLRSTKNWQKEIERGENIVQPVNEIRPFMVQYPTFFPKQFQVKDLQQKDCLLNLIRNGFQMTKNSELNNYLLDSGFEILRNINNRVQLLRNFSYHNSSCVITEGIEVHVKSGTSFGWSNHQRNYHFPYSVTIKNVGLRPVQLKSRHWVVTDFDGIKQEYEGPGVIGKQPILNPGESYQYQSYTELRTPYGTMKGAYTMQYMDDLSNFKVSIAPFGLITAYTSR